MIVPWFISAFSIFLTGPFKGALSGLRQFLATESPLKWWRMLFISSQKFVSFTSYLSFFLGFLVMYQNGLIRKIRLISNFFDATAWLTSNCNIYILPNISRSKFNQIIKFGQLIECSMWNIFLEKLCTKCGGEPSPISFSEKLKLSMSLDQ